MEKEENHGTIILIRDFLRKRGQIFILDTTIELSKCGSIMTTPRRLNARHLTMDVNAKDLTPAGRMS